ncbi:MAG: hypothetical protein PHH17_01035 [Candidatus Pacebacteria bacterium]|jgi:hypothetical protein|nr:hypothetical protein [Candidatus Paceibacterota bacterium]MDD3072312.1 hypothetical protein [Candidatus Paceibacterota bacterium]MDD3728898.1 hypothetical protein [Candidatus Paceibacterota bacterium]MDD4201471.1 hypothetical protein [Candidatus Paceibacterota bacterium]MDD4467093.1 hypothetical protein [Candidatus Paceibacterota bacterium]
MQEDSLSKIMEAEEVSEKEIEDYQKELQKRKEDRICFWEEKIAKTKKEDEEKRSNLKKDLQSEFANIDKEIENKRTGQFEELKNKARKNFDLLLTKFKREIL